MMDFLVYAAAYLIGSIPMGRLLKGGKKGSAKQLKFVLDMAKGAAAVTLARLASPHDEPDWVLSGFLAMMADEFPFYAKFKGMGAPAPRPPVEGQALGVPVPGTELVRASTGTGFGLGVTIGVFAAVLGWLLAR